MAGHLEYCDENLRLPFALSCGDVNHRFVQVILPIRHLVAVSVIRSTVCFPLECLCATHPILLNNGPKA